MAYDEKTAERVRNLLSVRSDVVERKLMGGLCFMVKGAMCCSVNSRGGLLVRRAEAQKRMLGDPHVRPMEMGGRAMSGFVRVIPEGYRTEAALKKWIRRGVDSVETLGAERSRRMRSQRDVPKRRRMK